MVACGPDRVYLARCDGDHRTSEYVHLNAQAEHLLDWFHLTMRITVMAGMAKSLRPPRRTRSSRTHRRPTSLPKP